MSQKSDVRVLVRACNAPPGLLTEVQVAMCAVILGVNGLADALALVATFKRAQAAQGEDEDGRIDVTAGTGAGPEQSSGSV